MVCKIILVNWKRAADTCACLASLERLANEDWYAVVCDNGSPDDSVDRLRAFLSERYSERVRSVAATDGSRIFDYYSVCRGELSAIRVTFVAAVANLGFAGGNNLAYRHARSDVDTDFVWFLNNDTEVAPDSLLRLVERVTQDPMVGICGSTLVYAHDRRTVQAQGGAVYVPMTGAVREIGNGTLWPRVVDRESVEREMRYVSGASMLVTRSFLDRVGLMSEDYFLYYEEIDWAERGRRCGFRLGYAPESVVYHKEGAVLGSGTSARRSALAEYYALRNRLVVTRKFFRWALPTVYLFSLLQVVRRVAQGQWSRAWMMLSVLIGLRRSAPG
ncbi:glycosyltransferase family 2 protein [Denitromonas sp. IR12]|uniref:Glycosyltransferase family 2 protein n=2 Tax=Denitromonas iodatirespirans TaxID=2795389 RepID=A0A944DCW4_DENI1|nr:glycosyltransferase family 2 protein [Denitromonas iodatirespirans]